MQKEDWQWVIFALGVLVVIALIVKPVATHEPPNFGIPDLPALPVMPVIPSAPSPVLTMPVITPATPSATTVPATAVPTPAPTISGTEPAPTVLVLNGTTQTIGFVDPSTYNVNLSTFTPRHNEFIPEFANQTPYRSRNYTSLLKTPITGQYSGTTQVIEIPFPYWELWYTIEPTASDLSKQGEVSGKYVIQPTQGQGTSASGAQGSYSTVKPTFNVDIMESGSSSRLVRSITPMGSIDPSLWKKNDPRPWKEKFFEGQKSYYFIIKAGSIKSYSLDIKVPNNYLGKI